MNKNRSKEQIIADILSVVMNEPRKTHIMYGANLSYALLCKYLEKLVDGGLIVYRIQDEVYQLTSKGEAYLAKYLEFERIKNQVEAARLLLEEKEANLTKILEASRSVAGAKPSAVLKTSRTGDDNA